eukprot:CCRYP_000132-RA/>CCRYP_000132-RA protein AED:0.00 eAED:0.00 QI:127/-1/1/1/-1/1/1/300/302
MVPITITEISGHPSLYYLKQAQASTGMMSKSAIANTCTMLPTIFLNHGGGPLPLLNRQPSIASSIQNSLPSDIPSAILIISAHYESAPIAIQSRLRHKLLFDYYGFPPESYQYKYSPAGDEKLAQRIHTLLAESNVPSQFESERGLDHGMFVPLMLMYPEAEIPVVGLSLHPSLDVDIHLTIGKALRPLRQDNVLIIGSGYAFHNMQYLLRPTEFSIQYSKEFDLWLRSVFVGKINNAHLENKLVNWKEEAPHATECHPREEHLIPLFVVAAAAGEEAVGEVDAHVEGKAAGEHVVSNFRFS